jgi:hypothetical protein
MIPIFVLAQRVLCCRAEGGQTLESSRQCYHTSTRQMSMEGVEVGTFSCRSVGPIGCAAAGWEGVRVDNQYWYSVVGHWAGTQVEES